MEGWRKISRGVRFVRIVIIIINEQKFYIIEKYKPCTKTLHFDFLR